MFFFLSSKSLTLLASQDTPGNKGQQQPIKLLQAHSVSMGTALSGSFKQKGPWFQTYFWHKCYGYSSIKTPATQWQFEVLQLYKKQSISKTYVFSFKFSFNQSDMVLKEACIAVWIVVKQRGLSNLVALWRGLSRESLDSTSIHTT